MTPAAPRAAGGPTVYLIHFDRPYRHAQHYTGWTAGDLDARLKQHEHGAGARLMAVIAEAGIGWTLARTWQGSRARERQLKRQGGASRRCPICRAQQARAATTTAVAVEEVLRDTSRIGRAAASDTSTERSVSCAC